MDSINLAFLPLGAGIFCAMFTLPVNAQNLPEPELKQEVIENVTVAEPSEVTRNVPAAHAEETDSAEAVLPETQDTSSSLPVASQACGDFIEVRGLNRTRSPIANCANPFSASASTLPLELRINGQLVNANGTISIPPTTSELLPIEITFTQDSLPNVDVFLYEKVGEDYEIITSDAEVRNGLYREGDITGPGEYVAQIMAYDLNNFVDNEATVSLLDTVLSYVVPTAHAYRTVPNFLEVTVIHFTVTEDEVVSDELSELLLTYEPILQFHEEEDYFPMNVDAFVEGSGLWDSSLIDELLIPRVANPLEETNELTLDYLATTTDTSNWYISFSSDEPGEFDLREAKSRYDSLVEAGKAVPTYYAHQSEHSYVDDLGTKHGFIVLQYWYFYAMNNWAEKGGFNDHEGDWESVFVFLEKETKEPIYAAFSAHHNDGDPGMNLKQYESVRRTWVETERNQNQIISFVAAGAHALYPDPKVREILTPVGYRDDRVSRAGEEYNTSSWKKRSRLIHNTANWVDLFEGKFGTNKIGFGSAGIEVPLYNNVSGTNRFLEPLEWAGIDQITKIILDEPTRTFDLPEQDATIIFGLPLPTGSEFSSAPHEEFISFGSNADTIRFLPRYWDINVSEPNGSFIATTTFGYTDEQVNALGLDETIFGIYFYNEETNFWEEVPSTVNTMTNTVTFTTNHFSIYAIGEIFTTIDNPSDTDTTTATSSYPIDSGDTGTTPATSTDPISDGGDGKQGQIDDIDGETRTTEESRSGPRTGTRVNRDSQQPRVLGASTDTERLRLELMRELIELLRKLRDALIVSKI